MQVLISDLDGTLIDVSDRYAQAIIEALDVIGYNVDIHRARTLYQSSLTARDLLAQLNIRLSRQEFGKYIGILTESFYSNWQQSQVFPGTIEALEKISPKIRVMRLITSRRRGDIVRREVSKFGLDKYFDKVFTREDLAQAEGVESIPLIPFVPHRRRLIRLAIQDINHGAEVWVVGDTAGELKAARSLGFTTIGVLTGINDTEELAPYADHLLNAFAEIVDLI